MQMTKCGWKHSCATLLPLGKAKTGVARQHDGRRFSLAKNAGGVGHSSVALLKSMGVISDRPS
jgi:hypothetical protein